MPPSRSHDIRLLPIQFRLQRMTNFAGWTLGGYKTPGCWMLFQEAILQQESRGLGSRPLSRKFIQRRTKNCSAFHIRLLLDPKRASYTLDAGNSMSDVI